jgi:hypothetical protein
MIDESQFNTQVDANMRAFDERHRKGQRRAYRQCVATKLVGPLK